MKGSVLVLASLCFVAEGSGASDICPAGWIHFGLSCYKFSTDYAIWSDAQSKCKEMGAYLAEVESKEETYFLQTRAGPNQQQDYWLGGKDDITEGDWYWTHSGKPFSFTNWGPGEPNSNIAGNEDCLQLFSAPPHKWNDLACDYRVKYICEKRFTTLSCPKNSHYKHLMTSCPATCTERDAHIHRHCKLEPREGCECDHGYILSDTECVPIANCGCKMDNGQYIPVGKKIETPCEVIECVLPSSGSIHKITTTKATCKGTCPQGWKYFRNSCYKLRADRKTWDNAQDKCKELGAYLAEVESIGETAFLHKYVVSYSDYWVEPTQTTQESVGQVQGIWLGGRDDNYEGDWYWANSGNPFKFTHWNIGEPSNVKGDKHCVYIWNYCFHHRCHNPNRWNDMPCNTPQSYICEKRSCDCSR